MHELQYFRNIKPGGCFAPPHWCHGGQTIPLFKFLKYCKSFISAQEMPIYFRLHCLMYIFNRGVDVSQANLLKKALWRYSVVLSWFERFLRFSKTDICICLCAQITKHSFLCCNFVLNYILSSLLPFFRDHLMHLGKLYLTFDETLRKHKMLTE